MPVVAWSLAWRRDVRLGRVNAKTTYNTEAEAREYADMCMEPDQLDPSPGPIQLVALVRQSDALAALTLVQAERDAMQQERDGFREAALRGVAALQDVQQERDELRAALERVHASPGWAFLCEESRQAARAALTPKATQQEQA